MENIVNPRQRTLAKVRVSPTAETYLWHDLRWSEKLRKGDKGKVKRTHFHTFTLAKGRSPKDARQRTFAIGRIRPKGESSSERRKFIRKAKVSALAGPLADIQHRDILLWFKEYSYLWTIFDHNKLCPNKN
jgi:hypothetical protein